LMDDRFLRFLIGSDNGSALDTEDIYLIGFLKTSKFASTPILLYRLTIRNPVEPVWVNDHLGRRRLEFIRLRRAERAGERQHIDCSAFLPGRDLNGLEI